ncbi:MAG: class I SAM-dependent methyltransferase [Candidatus Binatus sp.]|uniref:class I SAM-dependent methyltransferase n=1 Tax=Candidatus Binatus sp. TaxID=2811406 RepID=UPI00271C4A68|nr:class I SAM-dependent methyltransferase [Candidatus Binatus sp.]MDO8431280.1 class I SAM-dependent methyltransferase [Candidatus Binatus sp.]
MFLPTGWEPSRKDVTEIVRSFYEETPFPNYDSVDSRASLIEKARRGMFARALDQAIGESARILDAGCGTGQLSNFLGLCAGREVFGADVCVNSLRLAHRFKVAQSIDNVSFMQMNLFRPAFKPDSFDLVISNGVLHHTADPFEGFKSIGKLVRAGGYVVVGLYNKFGRLPLDLRRVLFRLTGDRFEWLDSRLRDPALDSVRRKTWFMDQYRNPHESKHTIDEVLGWFDKTGFEFINGIPATTPFAGVGDEHGLFEATPKGNSLDHLLVQLAMILKGGREGGFFVMIGRKRN